MSKQCAATLTAKAPPLRSAARTALLVLYPQDSDAPSGRGTAYYGLGDFEDARASCETRQDEEWGRFCLAIVYYRLGRHAEAEAEFFKMRTKTRWPYQHAEVYAQWGNTSQALESLESAWRLRDPDLRWLKADPSMDPLRKEPRFQAIERAEVSGLIHASCDPVVGQARRLYTSETGPRSRTRFVACSF